MLLVLLISIIGAFISLYMPQYFGLQDGWTVIIAFFWAVIWAIILEDKI